MAVEVSIKINAHPSRVWTVISSIKNLEVILSGVEKIEMRHEAADFIGTKWSETRMFFGKPEAIDKWITGAETEIFYTTRSEMDGFIFTTTFKITRDGDGTLLTSIHTTKSKGFWAKIKSLPMVFFKGVLRKAILKDLNDIKAAVETKK